MHARLHSGEWIVDAYNLSFAALVPVGGSLGDRFGRKTTLISVALILTVVYVPQSRDPETPPLDVVGLLLSIVALAALVTAIIQAPEWGWGSPQTLGLGILAVIVAVVFAKWEAWQTHPMLDVTLFRNMTFTAASGAVTFAFFALFGFIFLITQYFQFVRGYSPFESGLRVIPVAVSIAISSIIGPRLAVQFGSKRMVALGLVSMSTGFGWIAVSNADMSYLMIIGQMIFLGFGLGFTSAPATVTILGAVLAAVFLPAQPNATDSTP